MDLEYPRENDPFATADADKIAEYRVWAHRALDKLLDYRLTCEQQGRGMNQPYHSDQADYVETDDAANDLYTTTLMFANKLIGRRALAFNAEMFDERSPQEMRAALRKVIRKISVIWPSRSTNISVSFVRRSIQDQDLISALIELDKGHTPRLCKDGDGRETDLMKERCRFAGALWSIYLEESGYNDPINQVVKAFRLGDNGDTTVRRWKKRLNDPREYAINLGHDDNSVVQNLLNRAKSARSLGNEAEFGYYISAVIFGKAKPSLATLEGVGDLFGELRGKPKKEHLALLHLPPPEQQ